MRVSLVIPVRDEETSISTLFESIMCQTRLPDEVVFVDGGSRDSTVSIIDQFAERHPFVRVITSDDATPGKGRNLGTEAALNDWIAYTDAGIVLECDWLESLIEVCQLFPEAEVVYGNYNPIVDTRFERLACVSYCPPMKSDSIRGRSVVSMLLRKSVWEKVGGFPDLRAAEDLIFMEKISEAGFISHDAPDASVNWHLRPDFSSTFKKFELYSRKNASIGRTHDWHRGIARQYLLMLPFILLGLVDSYLWLIAVPAWFVLRAVRRSIAHRYQFGPNLIVNPLNLMGLVALIVLIDVATFTGWSRAAMERSEA